jgi:hypothetical protein
LVLKALSGRVLVLLWEWEQVLEWGWHRRRQTIKPLITGQK